MTEPKSLRAQILEHLSPKIAPKSKTRRPQRIVESAAPRNARALPTPKSITEAVIKKGSTLLYQGRPVTIQSFNESTGMAVVKMPRRKEPIFVRGSDLQKTQLNETFLGMAPIGFTYVEPRRSEMVQLEDLRPEDIGLDLTGLLEDDEEEDKVADEGDDSEPDNGSNIGHDGAKNKTEVDALPKPSDTIAPAYSDDIPPKEEGSPLSIETGAEPSKLWQAPDWDGYDYPADAPNIPTPEFGGADMGNSRAPTMGGGHDAGDGQGEHDEVDEEVNPEAEAEPEAEPEAELSGADKFKAHQFKKKTAESYQSRKFNFLLKEIDDLLGHSDKEPKSGDSIQVSLPAMASILCTAQRCQDENMLRAMIEALAEVGHGKCLDVEDLQAVASHVNGEEAQEMDNRDGGRPDHEGIGDQSDSDDEAGGEHHFGGGGDSVPPQFAAHDEHEHEEAEHDGGSDYENPPGDGESTSSGKKKLFGGMGEAKSFYGISSEDIVREEALSEEDEIRVMKRRAGMRYW